MSAIPIPRPWGARLRANPTTIAGVAIIALVVLLAIFAGFIVLANAATDIAYGLIDPRVRYR